MPGEQVEDGGASSRLPQIGSQVILGYRGCLATSMMAGAEVNPGENRGTPRADSADPTPTAAPLAANAPPTNLVTDLLDLPADQMGPPAQRSV